MCNIYTIFTLYCSIELDETISIISIGMTTGGTLMNGDPVQQTVMEVLDSAEFSALKKLTEPELG